VLQAQNHQRYSCVQGGLYINPFDPSGTKSLRVPSTARAPPNGCITDAVLELACMLSDQERHVTAPLRIETLLCHDLR
jgi:hypothetical protein